MIRKKRFKTAEEEIEAIRKEPEFQALVEDLRSQTPEQVDRLEDYVKRQEEANGKDDSENS